MPTSRTRNPFTDPLEKSEQAKTRRLLLAVGCCVYSLDQWRATGQTPGLYDSYVVHPGIGVTAWLDSKRRKGGRVSEAQALFRSIHEVAARAAVLDCAAKGHPITGGIPATVIGNYEAAEAWLLSVGLGIKTPAGPFVARPVLSPAFHEWCAMMRKLQALRATARARKSPRTRRL
jgi:hypothetical protein